MYHLIKRNKIKCVEAFVCRIICIVSKENMFSLLIITQDYSIIRLTDKDCNI